MEAAVKKEAGMTEWSDDRLDDLSKRVDRIETKMDNGFARLEKKMDEGFEGLHRMLFQAAWGFAIGLLGLVGLIATKL